MRIWIYLGLVIALLAFIFGLFVIGRTLMLGRDLPGYATLITVVLFPGGVQLIGLGVLGEYIGWLYGEAEGCPIYIVRERYDDAT